MAPAALVRGDKTHQEWSTEIAIIHSLRVWGCFLGDEGIVLQECAADDSEQFLSIKAHKKRWRHG